MLKTPTRRAAAGRRSENSSDARQRDDRAAADPGPAQPTLIPMSEDELREAGHKLSVLIGKLETLKGKHAAARDEMKHDREHLEKRIATLAGSIRAQGR
jgi:hypothetical protein